VNLGVTAAQLRERKTAAATGNKAGVAKVKDVARSGTSVHSSKRYVFDVTDDGDAPRYHVA
jgi:hypothetical protein